MKFLTINGKIQTLGGKPITVPDTYDNDLIKIGGKLIKTGVGLIGSKHSSGSGGGGDVTPGATFEVDGVMTTLTWEELKDSANGETYAYDSSQITDNEIGQAFFGCLNLKSITLPNSINSIDNGAFDSCFSLTSANLGSVTFIEGGSFGYCINLTNVTIPNSVTLIGTDAFMYCENLTDINFNGTKAEWNTITGDEWYNNSSGNYTIHCTDGDIAKS